MPLCSLCRAQVSPMTEKNFGIDIGDHDKAVTCPLPVRALVCANCLEVASNKRLLLDLKEHIRECLHELHPSPQSYQTDIEEVGLLMASCAQMVRACKNPVATKVMRDIIRGHLGALEIENFPACWVPEECEKENPDNDCRKCTSPRKVPREHSPSSQLPQLNQKEEDAYRELIKEAVLEGILEPETLMCQRCGRPADIKMPGKPPMCIACNNFTLGNGVK